MAGVYIPGMEMPNGCAYCAIKTDWGTCGYYSISKQIAGRDVPYNEYEERREDCPLVPATDHGRLVVTCCKFKRYESKVTSRPASRPQTNSDRIRAMSDEELARVLMAIHWDESDVFNDIESLPASYSQWHSWLKQEAKYD